MKMKIAMLLALIMLCVCTAASAQEYYTLPEIREQAAAGWHETYTDKYGRTRQVDIDIEVFGADTAPVLKLGWPDYMRYSYVENNPYVSLVKAESNGGERTYVYSSIGEKIELGKNYAVNHGNNLTPQEVFDFLGSILEKQGISKEVFIYDQPALFQVVCSTSKTTGEILADALYLVELWPQLYGIPVLTHVSDSYVKEGSPILTPRLNARVRSESEYTITVLNLIETELLAEDIPLCSLKKVIQSLEKEIEAGYIQDIVSVRFGYSVYNDPMIRGKRPVSAYEAKCFYAVPSWVIGVRFMENPKMDFDEEQMPKYITVNAQTGKIPDFFDKSKSGNANTDFAGFIPWDKAQ